MAESTEAKSYTLAEAASLTGLSVDALRKRILRGKVRANKSNEDGLWRVWLAEADIAASQELDLPPDMSSQSSALQAELAAVREALDRERSRADQAEGEARAVRERMAAAEMQLEAERIVSGQRAEEVMAQRERVARAEGMAIELRKRISAVEGDREAARAELDAYRRAPWWRRMLWRP